MNSETRMHFIAHVRKLVRLATECADEERRLDAVRSLACLALLSPEPIDPNDGGEVIDLTAYLKLAA